MLNWDLHNFVKSFNQIILMWLSRPLGFMGLWEGKPCYSILQILFFRRNVSKNISALQSTSLWFNCRLSIIFCQIINFALSFAFQQNSRKRYAFDLAFRLMMQAFHSHTEKSACFLDILPLCVKTKLVL